MLFRQLRYFQAIGKLGSFVRASQQLYVSQPALSIQIKELETALGVSLFSRHSRGVALTPAGEVLMRHADKVLSLLTETERVLSSFRPPSDDTLRVGLSPTPNLVLRPELVKLLESEPRLRVVMQEGLSDDLYEEVLAGKLSAAFCYDPGLSDRIHLAPLYSEDLFLVGPPAMVQGEEDIPFSELSRFPLFFDSRFRVTRRQILAMAENKVALQAEVAPAVSPTLLKRRRRCSIVPYGLFRAEIVRGGLVARRISDPVMSRTMCLVFQQGTNEKTMRLLISIVSRVIKTKIATEQLGWRTPQVRPVFS